MLKFDELIKAIDKDIRIEIYNYYGDLIYNGQLKNLKNYPDSVLRIVPQSTSREVYLEIIVY